LGGSHLEFTGRLLEMSNYAGLPGKAGGSPIDLRNADTLPFTSEAGWNS